jgi:CDP-paratose synthetase
MFKKQVVLLTGATGFFGSYLLESLLEKGNEVIILKRSTSNIWRIKSIFDRVRSYDIDLVSINEAFKKNDIDIIIHTACDYGRNNDSISSLVESNLMYGLRVLEAGIKFNVETFINTDSLLPKNLNSYSLSKRHFVEWLEKMSKNIQIINFKLEHMYGSRDDSTKFVSWIISQLKCNKPEIKLTEGRQLRDFIHVDDVVSAYMIAIDKKCTLDCFNEFDVGTGQLISIKVFLESVMASYKKNVGNTKSQFVFGAIPYREGEEMVVKLDNSKLRNLGWAPTIQLDAGLQKIMQSFKFSSTDGG